MSPLLCDLLLSDIPEHLTELGPKVIPYIMNTINLCLSADATDHLQALLDDQEAYCHNTGTQVSTTFRSCQISYMVILD